MLLTSLKIKRRTPNLALASRFRQAEAGIAAVEFAFLLPVLLIIYVYLVEFYRAFDEKRKLDRLAATIADVTSQQTTSKPVPQATVGGLLNASAALTAPFPASDLAVTVSVVALTAKADATCCDAHVRWSFTLGGTLRPCGVALSQVPDTTAPAPGNILASVVGLGLGSSGNSDVVVTDVANTFLPLFPKLFTLFGSGFSRTTYSFVRSSGALTLQSDTPLAPQQAQSCI